VRSTVPLLGCIEWESGKVDRCYFCKQPPKIELRGGLVFIRPIGGHCEIAVTPNVLREFAASASETLARWQIDQLGRVVPISRPDAH